MCPRNSLLLLSPFGILDRDSLAKPFSYHLSVENCRNDPHIETGYTGLRRYLEIGCGGRKNSGEVFCLKLDRKVSICNRKSSGMGGGLRCAFCPLYMRVVRWVWGSEIRGRWSWRPIVESTWPVPPNVLASSQSRKADKALLFQTKRGPNAGEMCPNGPPTPRKSLNMFIAPIMVDLTSHCWQNDSGMLLPEVSSCPVCGPRI